MSLVLSNKGKGMQSSSEQPLVGEERYVTTRITAAKETINFPALCAIHKYSMVTAVLEKKRIILNILPESKRHELKFSMKIAFSFLAITLNWQVPNSNISLVIRKKVNVIASPSSANLVFGPRIM